MASDAKLNVKINADVSEYQSGIIRAFVATLDDEGRAALLDALLEAEGYEKVLAIAFDGSSWAAHAAAPDEETCWIYVPKEPTDGD